MAHSHHRAVPRCPGDAVAPFPALTYPDRMMQADCVRDAALVVFGCDDPDLSGELACDPLENLEARRLNAIVVSNKNAIQHNAAPICRPSILYPSAAI